MAAPAARATWFVRAALNGGLRLRLNPPYTFSTQSSS
jgi:hypothetical protein